MLVGMPSIDVSGRSIHFLDEGSGPAVLFAHGFFMDATMFEPQMKAFRGTHRVISWDLRGHGQSSADVAPFTYWDQAADGFALLDALGVASAVVVGMSQGGYVALRMALAEPTRVDGLVLIDTQAAAASADERAGYRALFEQWLADGPTDELALPLAQQIVGEPSLVQEWVGRWRRRDRELIRYAADCILNRDDITDSLGDISCPTAVIHGSADQAIPVAEAQRLHDDIAGESTLTIIEGAPHASSLTHPAQANAAIAELLSP
jgi:pimeloyl-ACP methyl ester carboxylesterase